MIGSLGFNSVTLLPRDVPADTADAADTATQSVSEHDGFEDAAAVSAAEMAQIAKWRRIDLPPTLHSVPLALLDKTAGYLDAQGAARFTQSMKAAANAVRSVSFYSAPNVSALYRWIQVQRAGDLSPVRVVDASRAAGVTDERAIELGLACPNVHTFALDVRLVSPGAVALLTRTMPKLAVVTLVNLAAPFAGNAACVAPLQDLPDLHSLTLERFVCEPNLFRNLRDLQGLRHLTLRHGEGIVLPEWLAKLPKCVESITLERVRIENNRLDWAAFLPNLRHLRLGESVVPRALPDLPNLESLEVNVNWLNSFELAKLPSSLRRVSFSDEVPRNWSGFTHLKQLEDLALRYHPAEGQDPSPGINLDFLRFLPNLRRLEITNNDIDRTQGHHLRTSRVVAVKLVNCTLVKDADLPISVQEVHIEGPAQFTVVNGLWNRMCLRSLTLPNCDARFLARDLPFELNRLVLDNSPHLQDGDLEGLRDLPELRYLSVRNCPQITDRVLDDLRATRPLLKSIDR